MQSPDWQSQLEAHAPPAATVPGPAHAPVEPLLPDAPVVPDVPPLLLDKLDEEDEEDEDEVEDELAAVSEVVPALVVPPPVVAWPVVLEPSALVDPVVVPAAEALDPVSPPTEELTLDALPALEPAAAALLDEDEAAAEDEADEEDDAEEAADEDDEDARLLVPRPFTTGQGRWARHHANRTHSMGVGFWGWTSGPAERVSVSCGLSADGVVTTPSPLQPAVAVNTIIPAAQALTRVRTARHRCNLIATTPRALPGRSFSARVPSG